MELTIIKTSAFVDLQRHLSSFAGIVREYERKLTPPTKEKYLNGTDVCLGLRISKRALQKYRDSGIMPYTAIGGSYYYKETDIMRLLEEGKSTQNK